MNESTSLQTIDNNELTTGLETYSISINPVVLVQSNHIAKWSDAVPGAYRDTVTNKQFADARRNPIPLKIAPLTFNKQRVLFPVGDLNSKPICKSVNGLVPLTIEQGKNFGLDLEPQASRCDNCMMGGAKRWKIYHDPTSKLFGKPPECRERLQLTFIDVESELPYTVTFSAQSTKFVNNFVSSVNREVKSKANKETLLPCDFVVELSSTKMVSSKGTFFVAQFNNLEKVDKIGKYHHLFQEFIQKNNGKSKVDEVIDGELITA